MSPIGAVLLITNAGCTLGMQSSSFSKSLWEKYMLTCALGSQFTIALFYSAKWDSFQTLENFLLVVLNIKIFSSEFKQLSLIYKRFQLNKTLKHILLTSNFDEISPNSYKYFNWLLFNCCLFSLFISLVVDLPVYYMKLNQWLCPIFRRSLWYLLILLAVTVDWKVRLVWTSVLKPESTELLSQILRLFIYMPHILLFIYMPHIPA